MKISLGDLKYLRRISEGYFRTIPAAPNKPDPRQWRDDQLTLSWLGHATVLINFYGVWILTDPALRARVGVRFGPLTFGPKRYVAPALRTSELPPLDFILLTHAHMDHLDVGTLRRLRRDVTVVTASATADLLTPMRFRDVVEMSWGETRRFDAERRLRPAERGKQDRAAAKRSHDDGVPGGLRRSFAAGLSIEAIRVQHWGARMRHDVHRGFNGYVLERQGRRICIAGDTARMSFTAVGRKPTDVMVVPIGAYNPWIASHCTPEQAAEMADQARARFVVPVHHQTFRLSWEPMDEPIQRLRRALPAARLALSRVGETFALPDSAPLDGPSGRPIEAALVG
jgi:L-ascorbate metabolism protein UlaG (beta-lactamase superfamily)